MFNVKEVGLIIDLDHYPLIDTKSYKDLVNNFYIPFLRILKSHKESLFSLKISLHALDLLDRSGSEYVISEIKDLYQNERVEIVGSVPFKSPLINQTRDIIESQITLNEYGVGYYLGARQGFEGEPSVMLRDLNGFYSSGVEVSEDLFGVLKNLGYKWILSEEISGNSIEIVDNNINLIRGYDFSSDLESFIYKEGDTYNSVKENDLFVSQVDYIIEKLKETKTNALIIDLGRYFITHNKYDKLLRFLDFIFIELEKRSIQIISINTLKKKMPNRPKTDFLLISSFNESFYDNNDIENIDILNNIITNIFLLQHNTPLNGNNTDYKPNKIWINDNNYTDIGDYARFLSFIEYKIYEIRSIYDSYVTNKKNILHDFNRIFNNSIAYTIKELNEILSMIKDDDKRVNMLKSQFSKLEQILKTIS